MPASGSEVVRLRASKCFPVCPRKRHKSGHFLTAASCHNRTYAQHDFHFALVVPVLVRCP